MNISEFSLFYEEDKFYNYFFEKKFQLKKKKSITGKRRDMEILELKDIESILLNITHEGFKLSDVSVYAIVKVLKILGLKTIIQKVIKNFLCEFIKYDATSSKHAILDFLVTLSKIYEALDKLSRENKGNKKLVLEQLVTLESETSNLLSKTIEIIQKNNLRYLLDFDIEDSLFVEAIKTVKINQNSHKNKEGVTA